MANSDPARASSVVHDARFRLALEAAPTGMILVDRQGFIVLVNGQIERLFGYRREELMGQTIEIQRPHPHRAWPRRRPRAPGGGGRRGGPALRPGSRASPTLGLQLVQTLAEQLEGSFAAVPGSGATLQVTFPLKEEP